MRQQMAEQQAQQARDIAASQAREQEAQALPGTGNAAFYGADVDTE